VRHSKSPNPMDVENHILVTQPKAIKL